MTEEKTEKTLIKTGRTVEEATESALQELGVPRDRVEIEVLDEGTKGFFGLLVKPARIRVTLKEENLPVKAGHEFLQALVAQMKVKAQIETEITGQTVIYRLQGPALGVLIGHRGQTLAALQYLTNLVVNKGGHVYRVIIDAEHYREKRAQTLEELALRLAAKVKRQGRRTALEPMPAQERRVIHVALQNDPEVYTYSEGEEPYRRVVIAPKEGKQNSFATRGNRRIDNREGYYSEARRR